MHQTTPASTPEDRDKTAELSLRNSLPQGAVAASGPEAFQKGVTPERQA